MLVAFGFERVGVVAGDLYFLDPNPGKGQKGPEQGVRLEVRLLERGTTPGSIYSSLPISIGRPVWRADLLESVEHPGSFDRAHHHPSFTGWEPGRRRYVPEMSADPIGYVGGRLADLGGLLADAGLDAEVVGPADAADLADAAPEIIAVVRRLVDRVRAGELGQPPIAVVDDRSIRAGWL